MFLLGCFLRHLMRSGTSNVVDALGRTHAFQGVEGGPAVTVRLHKRHLARWMVFNPSLLAGEVYMNGTLTVENCSIQGLLKFFACNLGQAPPHPTAKAVLQGRQLVRPAHQINPAAARANAVCHYDLSGASYDVFLDADRQYSCVYFAAAGDDREYAQENKKHHTAASCLSNQANACSTSAQAGVEWLSFWLGRHKPG